MLSPREVGGQASLSRCPLSSPDLSPLSCGNFGPGNKLNSVPTCLSFASAPQAPRTVSCLPPGRFVGQSRAWDQPLSVLREEGLCLCSLDTHPSVTPLPPSVQG